ncbi:hypothetical protein SOVF_054060 [Spinacia oleracea]|uniref:Uncharacterized protein n=1 Tax=Spinacia oleracea TaxID=3562 RepID=A0A9R0JZZ4_SPIOL|nr:uncharacterized protein LOC110792247 [Spinacia oleracea]KNA20145.1 hypothetical protein SOVF_054060 [Spinacia oleracea]
MGNTSCIITSNSKTKVLKWDGGLRVYSRPVKAAELMLNNPGQFVCPFSIVQIGNRVTGLLADDELEPHNLYFLLPMDLLYSVLTTDEVSYMSTKAQKAAKFGSLVKKFHLFAEFTMFPSEAKRSETDSKVNIKEPDTYKTVFGHRSWRPALETIFEAT